MSKQRNGEYDVGYGKPPAETRFQKGQSGNPKGRPKGSKNLATIVRQAANERVTIVVKGKQRSITKLEAAAKQLANKAAQGDLKAMQMLLPQLAALDASVVAQPLEVIADDDKAVMASLMKRFGAAGDAGAGSQKKRKSRSPKKPKSGD
jgi:hypothetical protein